MGGSLGPLARPPLLLLCLLLAARADVQVVVNLQGASALDAAAVRLPAYEGLAQMDNSDLLVAPCPPGTFSPDHGGVCGPCAVCDNRTQYAAPQCRPTADAACHNCSLCADREAEYCACDAYTPLCYTGDRVCMPVPPSAVRLTLLLQSNAPLTPFQEELVQSGIVTGYLDWLAVTFGLGDVQPVSFLSVGPTRYVARFLFPLVYNQTVVRAIRDGGADFYENGVLYTFGERRRRLLQHSYSSRLVRVVDAFANCSAVANCTDSPFLAFVPDSWDNCTGACVPLPCPPGYTGDYGQCAPCPPGAYKEDYGNASCAPCPPGYASAEASNASADCAWAGNATPGAAPTTTVPRSTGQTSTPQLSSRQTSTGQTSTGQLSTGRTSTGQLSTGQTSTAELSTAELSTAQLSTSPTSTAQPSGPTIVTYYVTAASPGHDALSIATCAFAGLVLLLVLGRCATAWVPRRRSPEPVIPVTIPRRPAAASDLVFVVPPS